MPARLTPACGGLQFGAIDIDSELVAFKESTDGKHGQILMLNNGCLCCTVMGDLLDMLQDLVRVHACLESYTSGESYLGLSLLKLVNLQVCPVT